MASENETYRIGEAARESGASIDTIRYYEKMGLIDKPVRSESGFRRYSREFIGKLRFIRKAQSLGFSLREIKGIIQNSKKGITPCCKLVRGLFSKKIGEFETKIKEMEQMKKKLETLLSNWVSPKDARKKAYVVCPQIEKEPRKKRGT